MDTRPQAAEAGTATPDKHMPHGLTQGTIDESLLPA